MINDELKKILPVEAQTFYTVAFNESYKKNNSVAVAQKVAWTIVKNRLISTDKGLVALSENFVEPVFFKFELDSDASEFIINAEGDEITFEGILVTTGVFIQKLFPLKLRKFSKNALKDIANQINMFGSTMPDIDHENWTEVIQKHKGNIELIANALEKKKGLIKHIEATYEDGVVFIKGTLDKRYRKIASKVKGISIEAVTNKLHDDGKTISNAKYLGFTFAINKDPKISAATVSFK